jgi:hypothetical protein
MGTNGAVILGLATLPVCITSAAHFPVLTASHLLLCGVMTKMTLNPSGPAPSIDDKALFSKRLSSLVITTGTSAKRRH